MSKPDRKRIEDLRRQGRLSQAEADQIGAAVEFLEQAGGGPQGERRRRAPGGLALHKLRFLRGEMQAEELRALYRRVGVRMGVWFGVLMGLINALWFGLEGGEDGFRWPAAAIQFLGHLLISGPLFGWIMYRWILRPQAEGLVRLREEVGAPLEPLPATRPGQCPTCGAEDAKVWDRWHPAMLHWLLNPALAINELLLGQRVPERIETCRECGSQFVRCEGCGGSVDGSAWTARSQLGRWRGGLACPVCRHPIPCLRNALALALEWPFRLALGPARSRGADQAR